MIRTARTFTCGVVVALVVALVVIGRAPAVSADPEGRPSPIDTTPGQQAAREKAEGLARELASIADKHGPGAVALQAAFLVHCLKIGAVGPTEVRIIGPSPTEGDGFLRLEVDSGVILDESNVPHDDAGLWLRRELIVPVLKKVTEFKITPPGLDIVVQAATQDTSKFAEPRVDIDEPTKTRLVRVALPESVLLQISASAGDASIDVDQIVADNTRDAP